MTTENCENLILTTNDEEENKIEDDNHKETQTIQHKHNKSHKNGTQKLKHKKDGVNEVLKALSSLSTTEEKLAALCTKYTELFQENRDLQTSVRTLTRQVSTISKAKDSLQVEYGKCIFARNTLENLCRELQKQNRAIKAESLDRLKEEEAKRNELTARFQVTLDELSLLMKQDQDKTSKLQDDNIDMTTKLQTIYEQYEARELHVEKISKQMAIEEKLNEAKLAKLKIEMASEKEQLLLEKQQLLMNIGEYEIRLKEHENTEAALRSQLDMYTEKYDEFQTALSRSTNVFTEFKGEMSHMSNKIKELESEASTWKKRWEKCQREIQEKTKDKSKYEGMIQSTSKQLSTLEKLCRSLVTERISLCVLLKQNDIPIPSSSSGTDGILNHAVVEAMKAIEDVKADKSDNNGALSDQDEKIFSEDINNAFEELNVSEMSKNEGDKPKSRKHKELKKRKK